MSLFAFSRAQAASLARRRNSPCFAYRLDLARSRCDELRAVLPPRAELAYAVKANPGRDLIAALAAKGLMFDCASIGELELLRGASVPGSRILFAGPGKTEEELELALAMGARIQADGIEDLERVDAIVAERSRGKAAEALHELSLRVHPLSGVQESSGIIGGSGPSAFGVDEEGLPSFLAQASRFERVRIRGLQVFAASNELDAESLLANHRAAFAIGESLQRALGEDLDQIDLGGGLGIPYAEGEAELDIAALGSGLGDLLEKNPWFSGRLIVEPGRWIAGPIGVYIAKVLRVKESRGTRFAVLEGGINHLLRPLLTGQPFPACLASARAASRVAGAVPTGTEELLPCTLAGPLCTSLDRLGEALLPPLAPGDLVMLGQCGAYASTESMADFLLHPRAQEYWFEESDLEDRKTDI